MIYNRNCRRIWAATPPKKQMVLPGLSPNPAAVCSLCCRPINFASQGRGLGVTSGSKNTHNSVRPMDHLSFPRNKFRTAKPSSRHVGTFWHVGTHSLMRWQCQCASYRHWPVNFCADRVFEVSTSRSRAARVHCSKADFTKLLRRDFVQFASGSYMMPESLWNFFLLACVASLVKGEVFTSMAHLEATLYAERDIALILQKHVQRERERLDKLEKWVWTERVN